MFNRVSADGYFSDGNGGLDWVIPEPELDREAGNASASADRQGAMIFGRKTYEMFESFWPKVAADDSPTAPDPHHAGRHSPEFRAMAKYINEAPKIVFSKSLTNVTWNNSRLLRDVDPREVEKIKREPGGDIMIFGSGSIVSQLSAHRLIDEYWFVVSPLLLGAGKSLVENMPKSLKLELLEAKAYPEGNVKLRYAPAT